MARFCRLLEPVAVTVLAAVSFAPLAGVQSEDPGDRLTVDRYLDLERVQDPQISPDGAQVVYTRGWVNKLKDRWESSIWVMDADGSRNRFLVDGSRPRWSPDGTRILYVADGEPDGPQLFVRWMDAEGATSQVTREVEAPGEAQWGPNGRYVYFTRLVPDAAEFPIDMPAPPAGAEWTAPPRVVDRVHFRRDRVGFVDQGWTHVFRVPADGGTAQALTKGAWNVSGGFDLTPDGTALVFSGLMNEDDDTRYRESHIYALDLTGGEARQLTQRKGPWNEPRVSPDGTRIAFSGFDWTSQTYKTTELHLIGVDGSNHTLASGDLDRDVGSVRWAAGSDALYFTAGNEGTMNVYRADGRGGVTQLTAGEHMLSLTSASDDGTAVGVLSSSHEPGDVARYALRSGVEPTVLTHVNADVLAGIQLGEVDEVWYTSSGDARVQGWIVKPPDFDPNQTYPMILHIHGGPHGMYNVGFSYAYQNYAANGYVVLYTNPRGSTGYGTEFGNAIDNGYPSVDYDDLMAGVDAVIEQGYVNPDQLYVTGCSGGGVLTTWVVGHTDRFAAAGARCPVTNWMSFAGTADIVTWGYYRYEGYPWTNPNKYLEHSPLMYVGNVTTPTILMTGELDLRTPMSQTEEYYQALKAEGVETLLLRFNEEYHGTSSKPSNFMRTQLYLMKWFETYGGAPRAVTDSP